MSHSICLFDLRLSLGGLNGVPDDWSFYPHSSPVVYSKRVKSERMKRCLCNLFPSLYSWKLHDDDVTILTCDHHTFSLAGRSPPRPSPTLFVACCQPRISDSSFQKSHLSFDDGSQGLTWFVDPLNVPTLSIIMIISLLHVENNDFRWDNAFCQWNECAAFFIKLNQQMKIPAGRMNVTGDTLWTSKNNADLS